MSVRVFYDPHRVEQLRQKGIDPRRRQLASGPPEAQASTALELVEENARLRADNRRLSDEVARLTTEVARLSTAARSDPSRREEREVDDSARRFSLIELDL